MLVILYADDTVLFADSAVEMQIQLDNFSKYILDPPRVEGRGTRIVTLG
jgi:hypothetical protein